MEDRKTVEAKAWVIGSFEIVPAENEEQPLKLNLGAAIEFKSADDARAALSGTPVVIRFLED